MAVPCASQVHRRGTMSAKSSSPIDPAIGHLVELAADAAKDCPGLLGGWPGLLTRGIAAACATGWQSSWDWRSAASRGRWHPGTTGGDVSAQDNGLACRLGQGPRAATLAASARSSSICSSESRPRRCEPRRPARPGGHPAPGPMSCPGGTRSLRPPGPGPCPASMLAGTTFLAAVHR